MSWRGNTRRRVAARGPFTPNGGQVTRDQRFRLTVVVSGWTGTICAPVEVHVGWDLRVPYRRRRRVGRWTRFVGTIVHTSSRGHRDGVRGVAASVARLQ